MLNGIATSLLLLWEAGISKIVSPDGEEQEGITFEEAMSSVAFFRLLP